MNARIDELRRRLQALKMRREMDSVTEKMDTVRSAPVPNILLLRLLELEQQHLSTMRDMLHQLPGMGQPPRDDMRPSCRHNTLYRVKRPTNDNRVAVVG